jgi:predicted site-specific integrase-resolvase
VFKVMELQNEIRWIPVKTVAKILQVSRQRVYKLVKIGAIKAIDLDGNKLISLRSVRDFEILREKRRK